jgi:hypothetical protein
MSAAHALPNKHHLGLYCKLAFGDCTRSHFVAIAYWCASEHWLQLSYNLQMLRVLRPGVGLLLGVPDIQHHELAARLRHEVHALEPFLTRYQRQSLVLKDAGYLPQILGVRLIT